MFNEHEEFYYNDIPLEEYLSTVPIDDFKELIETPNFFVDNYQRMIGIGALGDNIEKKKLLLKVLIEKDLLLLVYDWEKIEALIDDVIQSGLLNYLFEIFPSDGMTGEELLIRLFERNFDLEILQFNDYNKKIIDDYIVKYSNDNTKLTEIFRGIYNSKSNWGEFIFGILIKEDKLNFFLDYYKELIDKSDNFATFKDKERLVSLLVFLIDAKTKDTNGVEFLLGDFMKNLFEKLSLEDSENDSKKIFSSPAKKLVTYMNELISPLFSIDSSYISTKILKNPILIKYILPENVIGYGNNVFLRESLYTSKSNDEIRKMFLEDDERNINLIKNLGSSTLIKFLILDTVSDNNLNDETINYLKELLKRYFSYERAIFFVDALRVNDTKKIEIINEVYKDRKINGIKVEKERLISRCKEELLSLSDEVSDLFKNLLPELIEISYDDELFNKLKNDSLKINKLEYLFVYLSQYFKYGCNAKDMDYNEYKFDFIPKYCRVSGSANGAQVIVNYEDYLDDKDKIIWQNVDYIETTNHEKTHLWQDKMSDVISLDALMIGLEKKLIFDNVYYNSNYYQVYTEIHARIVAFYETFKYLSQINPYIAYQYLDRNKHLALKNNEEKSDNKEVVNFINDRKKAKSIEYFANLINVFLEKTPRDRIRDLRKSFKTLELITDGDGRLYDVNEIEEKMNSIKSYGANDVEFNAQDRDTKLFYAKYLHNLRYCLENNLINFDRSTMGRSNS